MKAFQTIKYLAFAGAATLWSCSSQQYAQKQATEYDDLYFSSTDKKEVVYTASTSNNNYTTGNTGVASQDNSQKNVNPEYIQQYADQGRTENEQAQTNGSDSYSSDENYSYYDENYRKGDGGGVNLARQYNRSQSGVNVNFFPNYGFGSRYGGSSFYDPFYDPFYYGSAYYDPFFYRPFVRIRPGIIVNIGTGFGMGWGYGGWGSYGGWHDPFYSRMYDPFYGGYAYDSWGRPFYGGYGYNNYYNPYRYGYGGGNNVIIVNPSNGNNNDRRTVRYSPRSGRGSGVVNDNFDNTPRGSRAERGGRVDQSVDGNTNTGRGSSNPNISSDGSRPARAVRPGSGNSPDSYNNPQRSSQDVNAGGSRTYSPNVNGDNNSNRAVRPRGGNDGYDNNRSRNNTYYDNSSNSNRSSAPTYSSPSPSYGRSPRSNDNYSTPRNNSSWDSPSSGGSRSSGGYGGGNSGGGSYSSPRSGGDGGGGSRSPRSSR